MTAGGEDRKPGGPHCALTDLFTVTPAKLVLREGGGAGVWMDFRLRGNDSAIFMPCGEPEAHGVFAQDDRRKTQSPG